MSALALSGSNFTNDAGTTALVTALDLPEPDKEEQNPGVPKMFQASSGSFNQFGEFLRISLADYNIDMISEGDGTVFWWRILCCIALHVRFRNHFPDFRAKTAGNR